MPRSLDGLHSQWRVKATAELTKIEASLVAAAPVTATAQGAWTGAARTRALQTTGNSSHESARTERTKMSPGSRSLEEPVPQESCSQWGL